MNAKKTALIAASVAGLLAIGSVAMISTAQAADGVKCYGVNKCKGSGECGGKGHSCAGANACHGQGYITVADNDACLAMEGGSLTPKEA